MATTTNVHMIAGPPPIQEHKIYLTLRQRTLGVELVATRGLAESVLLTINNRFCVIKNENIDARLGFPRTDETRSIVIDDSLLVQPQREGGK